MKATKANHTTGSVTQPVAPAVEERPGVFDLNSVTRLLYERSLGNLTRAELKWIAADGAALAEHISRLAADVFERVGCLVSSDSSGGQFQTRDDVTGLLFHVSQTFRQVAGLVEISSDAACRVREGGVE